jgi:hypothetical protein
MNTRGIAHISLTSLALLVLATGGCEKFHDDFPTWSSTAQLQTGPAPSDPLPADLIGTWTSQSAVVDGQPWALSSVLQSRYHPGAAAIRVQFTSSESFVYELLDTSKAVIDEMQGEAVLHGVHLTCIVRFWSSYPDLTGFNIIDADWSLHDGQLVLPYTVDNGGDDQALVTYKRQ